MPSLYQKYRPKNFSEITGQEHIVQTLSNSIRNNRISQAYLFTGSRGIGKTTLARIFAKTVNCLDPQFPQADQPNTEPCGKCENCRLIAENRAIDLIEIDAASHTGVDNIRQLQENAQIPPVKLKYKVYIIDEVHMLSIGAFNALLKTLEEPPKHTIFILATTEIHKIPETIISRCQRFDFRRLSLEQIISRLKQIAKKELVKVEDEALELIAFEAEGGMRDAESLLGQIISIEDKEITAKEVSSIIGSSSRKSAFEFTSFFLKRDIKKTLEKIATFQSEGLNFKNTQKSIINFVRDILLAKANPKSLDEMIVNLSPEQKNEIRDLSEKISFEDLIFSIELLQKNLNLFKETSITQLPLEISAIEFYLRNNPEKIEKKQPKIDNKPNKGEDDIPTEKTPLASRPREKEEFTEKTETEKESKAQEDLQKEISLKNSPAEISADENSNATLETILDKWSEILEGVKPYNHSIHAFLKNCVPLGIDKRHLYIKTKYDFYKERLSEINNQLTIKKVVDNIIKCDLRISIITEKEASTMKFKNKSKQDRNILHDAMQMMGGRIVE